MSLSAKRMGLIVISALFIISCRKKEEIGLQLQPPTNQSGVYYTDTLTLKTSAVLENDSLSISGLSYLLAGAYTDPIFGKIRATAYSKLQLESENKSVNGIQSIDSVILRLAFDESYYLYGDTLENLAIGVERITTPVGTADPLHQDSINYTTRAGLTTNPEALEIATAKTPRPPSIRRTGDTIFLKNSFGQELLNLVGTGTTNATFQSNLYGIALVPRNDNGTIMRFNILNNNSYIEVRYHDGSNTRKTFKFYLSTNFGRFSTVISERAGADPVVAALGNPAIEVDAAGKVYLQSLIGIQTRIEFPTLQELKNKFGNIAINKAELVLPVDEATIDGIYPNQYRPISPVMLMKLNASNNPRRLLTSTGLDYYYIQYEGFPLSGGAYPQMVNISEDKSYNFDLSSYIHAILYGTEENNGLLIVPRPLANYTTVNRIVAGTGSDKVKLKIYYTRIE